MARKFLQVVGLLALIGLAAAGIASGFLIQGRLSITVVDTVAQQKAGPDPVALLRDEVGGMRRDVAALTQTLSKNFETLAARQDEAAAAAETALAKAVAGLKDAVARLSDTRAADERHREVVQALNDLSTRFEQALATRGAAPVPASAVAPANGAPASGTALPIPSGPRPSGAPPAPSAKVVSGRGTGTIDPIPAPVAAPASVPPSAPAGKRTSFLSFSLPSEGFEFDQVQRFEVIPELSRVGFDGKSTIHDFSGVTSDVSGTFTARLSRPGVESVGTVEARAATIDTGIEGRNKDMLDTLEVTKFAAISFTLTSFRAAKVDPKTMTIEGTAQGKMTIHGVTRDVAVPLRLAVDEAKRLSIEGEIPLRLTDYGITPPSKIGVINMENQVRVWLNLRARSAGRVDPTAGK